MNEDGPLFDPSFDDTGPFRVSPESGSVSLESALRDFGPAAIDDLIPRVRRIAGALDAAHRKNVVHGALQPSSIFVSDASTWVVEGTDIHPPYAAPEVVDGQGATAQSDQYSLAAITYEWMFGRPIAHAADRPVEVRSMPGVDRRALSKAFTRALAPKPADRFVSCAAFCDALGTAIVPELPLLAAEPGDDDDDVDEIDAHEPSEPIREIDDLAMIDAPAGAVAATPDFDVIDPATPPAPPEASMAIPEPRRVMEPQRFGPVALIFATLVGAFFGFAAGYMARPRALQSGPPQHFAVPPGTDAAVTGAVQGAGPATEKPSASSETPAKAPEPVPAASPSTPATGRLLVRSTPSGASVMVDGVARGVTPLALRELPFGTRDVTVARRGYVSESRKVGISKARPARTLEVRLTAEAASPRPGQAPPSKASVATGSLAVDSRPIGAAVTINGKPSGTTPMTINDLAPGEYRILMSMAGFRNFATTVRVVAGERVRAAASLTALEQE